MPGRSALHLAAVTARMRRFARGAQTPLTTTVSGSSQAIEPQQPGTSINIVLNWFDELKRRVPARKQ
jgi:hypothetical protein